MTPSELQLERDIEVAVLQFQTAKTIMQRRRHWEHFKRLVEQRSPEVVKQLEIEKGIHTPEGK